MAQSHRRFPVDLDQIERQLNHGQATEQASPSQAPKIDPMAELARIVGQNDPFRTLLSGDRGEATPRLTHEAGHAPRLAHAPADREQPAYEQDFTPAPHRGQADTDDELTPYLTDPGTLQRRSRKGLITVALIVGSAMVGVGGALVLRNGAKLTATGEPPIITADREPLKVPPENPGGVDIPNQDAQVYDRAAKDSQTRIVNREEQPVDVQQAARAMPSGGPRPIAGPAVAAAVTPGAPLASAAPPLSQTSAIAGLGEPRRVRTVSVRPDGTLFTPDQPSTPAPRPSAPSPTAGPAPAPSAGVAVPSAAAPPPAVSTTTTTPAVAPQPMPLPPQRPKLETRQPGPATPPTASASSEEEAVASRQPQRPQRTAVAAAPDAPETTSAAGGFTVQLSVMNSEQEARAQFDQLRRKFSSELSGLPPLIRAAEMNGKTIYRLRVGPMSQADAGALCNKLKSSGGNCFVARN